MSSYWGITICRVLLRVKQFAGSCFASSHWRITISRVLRSVTLFKFQLVGYCLASSYWGDYNFEAPVLCQVIGELQFVGHYNLQGFALCQAIGKFQLAVYYFAPSCLVSRLGEGGGVRGGGTPPPPVCLNKLGGKRRKTLTGSWLCEGLSMLS